MSRGEVLRRLDTPVVPGGYLRTPARWLAAGELGRALWCVWSASGWIIEEVKP